MKTTFHPLSGGTVALTALAIALSPAQAQQDGGGGAADFAADPAESKDSRTELLETSIEVLSLGGDTRISDVIEYIRLEYGIQLNAVFRDKAGEIHVPELNLRNVSLIDLLEVIESLTDVTTDIIANTPDTRPIVVFEFKPPKNPQTAQARATSHFAGAAVQEHSIVPATKTSRNSTSILTAQQLPNTDPDTKRSDVAWQVQAGSLKPVDNSTFVRVFPLSKFDVTPEDIIDFIDQILTLGANPKDQKVPSPQTLYHTGTKSLLVRGNAVQISEIEEALRQLCPDAFAASHLPGTGASTSKDPMKNVRRLFTPKAPTPTLDPFGDAGAGAGAGTTDPFGTPKKPAKPRPKAAADPFGGGPTPGGSTNPFAPAENKAEKPAGKAADPFG